MRRPAKIARERTAWLLTAAGEKRLSDLLGFAYEQGAKDAGSALTSPKDVKGGWAMKGKFRWEADCLADDPFAGDFGSGEFALSDKMVTNRKGGTCHTCAGPCEPGTRNRVLTERGDEGLATYRWCECCCFAMAVYGIRPSIGDARQALGDQRRAALKQVAE